MIVKAELVEHLFGRWIELSQGLDRMDSSILLCSNWTPSTCKSAFRRGCQNLLNSEVAAVYERHVLRCCSCLKLKAFV